MKSKILTREDLENFGSLITIKGGNNCLGSLMVFEQHGTHDAAYGQVPVTKEEADAHNTALDKAMVEGLEKNCKIGQCGTFFLSGDQKRVTTFTGHVVTDLVTVDGRTITFTAYGKLFRGRLQNDADCFNFRRIK